MVVGSTVLVHERSSFNGVQNERSSKTVVSELLVRFVAATYSPTWWGSTIGDGELNFSVRNGKRWILTAITATIYVLRKDNQVRNNR